MALATLVPLSIEVANKVYGIIFANVSSIILSDCNIDHNSIYQGNIISTSNKLKGGALSAFKSNVYISGCGNIAFKGDAFTAFESNVNVIFCCSYLQVHQFKTQHCDNTTLLSDTSHSPARVHPVT